MLRGYRLAIAAALGYLSLVGAGPAQESKAPTHQSQAQSDAAKQLNRIAAAIEKQGSGPSPDTGCREGKDDRQSDLCAQWKAADAAYDGQRWSWWQMVIGGVGLILGAVTMGAAIFAAIFAKRAAVATEATVKITSDAAEGASEALAVGARSATAAELAVHQTREIGEAQTRAYLSGVAAEITYSPDGSAFVTLRVKNFGQSPAFNVHWTPTISHFAIEPKILRKVHAVQREGVFEHDIAAQIEVVLTGWNFINAFDGQETAALKVNKSIYVTLAAAITGVDVFGKVIEATEQFSVMLNAFPSIAKEIALSRASKVRLTPKP